MFEYEQVHFNSIFLIDSIFFVIYITIRSIWDAKMSVQKHKSPLGASLIPGNLPADQFLDVTDEHDKSDLKLSPLTSRPSNTTTETVKDVVFMGSVDEV
jgi:hypothetical protein